jgi:polyhydroxyalkanoate synthase subunit PhaC
VLAEPVGVAQATKSAADAISAARLQDETGYRDVDRLFHAALASMTSGISPVSLLGAWQDWIVHLIISPGKQQEILAKAFEGCARLQHFMTGHAFGGKTAGPCISQLPQDRRFRDTAWQASRSMSSTSLSCLRSNGGTMPQPACPG